MELCSTLAVIAVMLYIVSCTSPASTIRSRIQLTNAGDSDLMTVENKTYTKGSYDQIDLPYPQNEIYCHIVDLRRSVPVGKEWQIGRFSSSLRMAPFPGGFTDISVARLWTRPTIDAEARLSSICPIIRIKIYTRTSSNKL